MATGIYMVKKGKGKVVIDGIKKMFSSFKNIVKEKVSTKNATTILTPKKTPVKMSKPIIAKPPVTEKIEPQITKTTATVDMAKVAPEKTVVSQAKPNTAEKTVNIQPMPVEKPAEKVITTQADKIATITDISFETKKTEFAKKSPRVLCKNSEQFIKDLKPHSYATDQTMIQINSKGFYGYESAYINSTVEAFPKIKRIPDGLHGIVGTLEDGKKFVKIRIPSGRKDFAGRDFENTLTFLSNGKEFTPMQKDIISIMSGRAKMAYNGRGTDIMSLAMFEGENGVLTLDKDIFLSSIETAKQQTASQVNSKLVESLLKNGGEIFSY